MFLKVGRDGRKQQALATLDKAQTQSSHVAAWIQANQSMTDYIKHIQTHHYCNNREILRSWYQLRHH